MKTKKFKPINGWTKTRMIKRIFARNDGVQATVDQPGGIHCVYETDTGNHCAVGCFIPRGNPALQYDGTVDALLRAHPNLSKKMPLDEAGLIQLQRTHDLYFARQTDESDVREFLKKWIKENVA